MSGSGALMCDLLSLVLHDKLPSEGDDGLDNAALDLPQLLPTFMLSLAKWLNPF